MINDLNNLKLAIIGLGYVGLPLALEFSKKRKVIGFDINKKRIEELISGKDRNFEFKKKDFINKDIYFTNEVKDIQKANCYILAIPTPINKLKKPNLKPLFEATKLIGKIIKKDDLVIFESTVYPGCTEDDCVPILERFSGLKYNKDFFCGYSPERINPGDKKNKISKIKKITSGSTAKISKLVDNLYKQIIIVGTYKASSIKIAEAAKVIENTQRDLNIAFINELSILFNKMNLDTQSVLKAAATKWNFLPFKPGLVGGHCIGVDPYYLTFKAANIGYKPKIILAGRKTNDQMAKYVASQLINKMKEKDIKFKKARILIMGLTFKENCADLRNAGIQNVIKELKNYDFKIDLFDPIPSREDIRIVYKLNPISKLKKKKYDAILIAVAHEQFKKIKFQILKNLCKKKHVIYDLQCIFKKNQADLRL